MKFSIRVAAVLGLLLGCWQSSLGFEEIAGSAMRQKIQAFKEQVQPLGKPPNAQNWYSPANLSPVAAKKKGRHVPTIVQTSHNRFLIRSPHGMDWVGDKPHMIDAAFVEDQDGNPVYYVDMETVDDLVNLEFQLPVDTPITRLHVFTSCNLHGLWEGNSLRVVDSSSWNLTLESIELQKERNQTSDQCDASDGIGLNIDEDRTMKFSLYKDVGASDLSPVTNYTQAEFLMVEMTFPTGTYLAVGLGDSMTNADMVICGESGGASTCGDYSVVERYKGPVPDTTLGGTNDVEVVETSTVNGVTRISCRKHLLPKNSLAVDKSDVSLSEIQDMVFAHGTIPAGVAVDPTTASWLGYHGLDNRGHASVPFNGADATLVTSKDRDQRDLKVVHGVLMYTIWGINIAVGAIIARYQRHTEWWLGAHRMLQTVSTIITLPVYFLTRLFVERPYASTHAIIGYVIIYSAWLQTASGMFVYFSGKLSKKFYDRSQRVNLPKPIQSMFAELERKDQKNFFYDVAHLIKTLPAEKGQIMQEFVADSVFLLRTPRSTQMVFYKFLSHVNTRWVRPMHAFYGKLLPTLAYCQMFLGVRLLQVNSFVKTMLIFWTALLGVIVVYKEIERQFDLPHGVPAKLVVLFRALQRICCCCCREKAEKQDEDFEQGVAKPKRFNTVEKQDAAVPVPTISFHVGGQANDESSSEQALQEI
uniref:DOMON domain-containing protein n=1 Tax=Mucochytrium quahogii TaxID=96639 RepID=A0A7S2RUD2_9STRA|mmetsp:Transcript_11444/g.18642  ORF Transcript_11444/g.18642 Transcript_11444/m.18642 type:complete len:700 (-) Transcript_11444:185-2284(-)